MNQFRRIPYNELNARQKKNYNFHKIAARLADYGFSCIWLKDEADDWEAADFLARHIDGETILQVQIKGRMWIERKYLGKGIHIAFIDEDDACYLYDHDKLVRHAIENGHISESNKSWHDDGIQHWPTLTGWATDFLEDYRI